MANPDQIKQAMVQPPAGPTDIFAVAYLQLCQLSYLDPSTIAASVVALPPLDPGGSWQCIWGPAQNSDESNLVFVAAYFMAAGMPPTFAAVVTRGTDVDVSDAWGVIEQIWEDLDVTSQVPLPWAPNNPALIASGTVDGLDDIQGLTSGPPGQEKTLLQFLRGYLSDPANSNPVLIVTGHSLGGCLTSVIAPWLQTELAGHCPNLHVVPATFAGPTAGNADFASYFQSSFGYSMRVFNSLDIVPRAWQDIDALDDIYGPCGIDVPDLVYAAVTGFKDLMWLSGVSYVQPATNQVPLTGSCSGGTDWYSEAAHQHHTTTYMTLLGGTSVIPPPATAALRRPASRSRLRKRFGPLAALPARPAKS
jgi:triacylglycerol lipase